MNKYNNFVREIFSQTKAKKTAWFLGSLSSFSDYIFSGQLAFRCFWANFRNGGVDYKLLLVEKKVPVMHEDSGAMSDSLYVELSIIKDGKLVITITEDHVGKQQLVDLLEVVEDMNSDAENLFKDFE